MGGIRAETIQISGGQLALLFIVLLVALVAVCAGFVWLCVMARRAGRGSRAGRIVTGLAVVWLGLSAIASRQPVAATAVAVLVVLFLASRASNRKAQAAAPERDPAQEPPHG